MVVDRRIFCGAAVHPDRVFEPTTGNRHGHPRADHLPDGERYTVLAHSITSLNIRDRRRIFQIARSLDSDWSNVLLPEYGFTSPSSPCGTRSATGAARTGENLLGTTRPQDDDGRVRRADRAPPRAPAAGAHVASVAFRTCPGTTLRMDLAGVPDASATPDAHGVFENSWWVVRASDLPDRALRLYRGARSLSELLRRYGFQDGRGCVNHKLAVVTYADDGARAHRGVNGPAWIPDTVRDTPGIPQFYPASGICWFAALCGTSFLSDDVRRVILDHVSDPDLRRACERCNHDRDVAEHLRKRLWYEHHIGDNVDNPPEMDGRNGFAEFSTLCAKFGVPLARYRERDGHLARMDPRVVDQRNHTHRLSEATRGDTPHLLALRFQDGDHARRFPIQRRVRVGDQRYKLTGLYMGQKKCGHQIGLTCPTGSWRDWMIVDADLHKDGISPVFIRFEGPRWNDRWWTAWRELVHVTKYGAGTSEFCNLSPWNEHNASLDRYRAASADVGTNSIDALYVPIRAVSRLLVLRAEHVGCVESGGATIRAELGAEQEGRVRAEKIVDG